MAELRWQDYQTHSILSGTQAQVRFSIASEGWVSRESFMGATSKFPDRAAAKRAVEVELIRRCKADLLALEDLHGD